jgi:hypothetical protein
MFDVKETNVLRALASQVRDLADDPRNETLRAMWRDHTSLRGERPLIFVSPEGSWEEILPDSAMRCHSPMAQKLERELRQRIFRAEHIRDDVPIERSVLIPRITIAINAGWGVATQHMNATTERGAWRHDPVIKKPSDWKKLKEPMLDLANEEPLQYHATVSAAIGDLLDVRLTGCTNFDFHMMNVYCDFRGLENMLFDLYDEPEMVHDVISFFTEGLQGLIDQLREHELIDLNNGPQFHYTGGLGYTHDLPSEQQDGVPVRTQDVWGSAEAQEFSTVSPDMHEEFILQYERKLLANFGLNGYGCCDDLTHKIVNVKKIKNLRRVAASPWADVEKCADQLGQDYLLTWKPQPSYLAGLVYDEAFVEDYLTEQLRRGAHGRMEIILRDTHSCRGEPERFTKFVTSARRAIQTVHGLSEHLWI